MKNIISFVSFLMLLVLLSSCKQEKSLQSYIVESQDKSGFMTIDIPASFIQFKSPDVSDDIKESLQSIRKINLVGLPYQNNKASYEIEKKTIKDILKNSENYKSLIGMDVKGMKVDMYYIGNTDSIDELIVFGYSKEFGVGLARILGNGMNPIKIIEMMKYVKIDPGQFNLEQFNLSFKQKTDSII